jgi:hypothetical protein
MRDFTELLGAANDVVDAPTVRAWQDETDPSTTCFALDRLRMPANSNDARPGFLELSVRLRGRLTAGEWATRLDLNYKETIHHPAIRPTTLKHRYIVEEWKGVLVEFGHQITVIPRLPHNYQPPREVAMTSQELDEADRGLRVLRLAVGGQLELGPWTCHTITERLKELAT